jgi:hypothetical protein
MKVIGLSGSEIMENFIYKLRRYTYMADVSASQLGDPGLNPEINTTCRVSQVYPHCLSNTFNTQYISVKGNLNN